MTKYDIILEELQNRVDSGEISYEFAESVNELAYEKYVTEKLETNILDLAGPNKKYTLYHCSNRGDLKTIKPNSLNMGTRLSGMRTSSFWGPDKECAIAFGLLHFMAAEIGIPFKMSFKNKCLYIIDAEFSFKTSRLGFAAGDVARSSDIIKKAYGSSSSKYSPIYLYTIKDVPIKDVGRGQYNIDEYTLDKEIEVDKPQKLSFSDVEHYIKYVSPEKFELIFDEGGGKSKKSLPEWLLFKNDRKIATNRNKEYGKAIMDGRYDRSTRSITLKK